MKVQVIVPAAGEGKRLKAKTSKPFVLLNNKPLICYCLDVFERCHLIDSVVVVINQPYISAFLDLKKKYRFLKVSHVVGGGATRVESVSLGLKQIDEDTDIVLIHDGVRPFVTEDLVKETVSSCVEQGCAVVAVKVKPTIKRVNSKTRYIEATLDRELLWEIQTPQGFKKDIILKAYAEREPNSTVTDDAGLVEKLGIPVKVVEGRYDNIKITTAEDLSFAEYILRHKSEIF